MLTKSNLNKTLKKKKDALKKIFTEENVNKIYFRK